MKREIQYLTVGVVLGGILIFLLKEAQPKPIQAETQVAEEKGNNGAISGYPIPEQLSFAGEKVPLERQDIRERLEREVQVNAFWHSNSVIMIKRANRWFPTIDSILEANDIPGDFKYLAVAESGLENVVSPSKAVGFWQFLRGTAGDFGLTVNREMDQRYDPVLATEAATKYLKQAYEKFGTWTMVAASYNLGMSATAKMVENQRPETYYDMRMSEEPSRYIFRILALKNMLENQEQFGFKVPKAFMYELEKTKSEKITQSIADLHEYALSKNTRYTEIRRLNPWIKGYKLTLKSGQILELKLPISE